MSAASRNDAFSFCKNEKSHTRQEPACARLGADVGELAGGSEEAPGLGVEAPPCFRLAGGDRDRSFEGVELCTGGLDGSGVSPLRRWISHVGAAGKSRRDLGSISHA